MPNTCLRISSLYSATRIHICRIYALELIAGVLYDVLPFASEGKSETDIDEVGESDIDKMHDLAKQHENKTVVTDIDIAEEGSEIRMVTYFISLLYLAIGNLRLFIWHSQ